MSLIDEVAGLKELEQKAEPNWSIDEIDGVVLYRRSIDEYPLFRKWGVASHSNELNLTVDLRNAAPKLLEVAGCFQVGDAEILRETAVYLLRAAAASSPKVNQTLCRLQKAAQMMEEET